MMITAIQDNPALSEAVARRASNHSASFAQALAGRIPAAVDQDKQVREAADQLVATTFILPLLEQIRSDPFKSELFHGGFAEDAFGQQLDTILADRIAQRTGGAIADAVYRSIRGRADSAADRGVTFDG